MLHQQGDRARFQTSWIVDTVEQFTDRPQGQSRTEQHSDVANLVDDDGVKQSLPRHRPLGVDKSLILVMPEHPRARTGALGQITNPQELPLTPTCLCH